MSKVNMMLTIEEETNSKPEHVLGIYEAQEGFLFRNEDTEKE
jgi:hypothetical protein